MDRLGKIKDFISHLGDYEKECVFNPWSDTDSDLDLVPHAWINRRLNYEDHLNCEPKYVLVGEAPSHRGCRYTGIPFTSEWLLYNGHVAYNKLIPRLEYNKGLRITTYKEPVQEASANAVWGNLFWNKIENDTVLFNAFPFHPYKQGNKFSNRKPSVREMTSVVHLINMMVDLYYDLNPIFIAVGRVAEDQLKHRADYHYVRHPSYGGNKDFAEQLAKIVRQES